MTGADNLRSPFGGAEVHLVNRTYWPAVGGVERQLLYLEELVESLGGTLVVWTATRTASAPVASEPRSGAARPRCPRWVRPGTAGFVLWVALGLLLHRALHPRRNMVVLAARASAETAAALPVRRLFGVPLITYLAGGDARGSEFSTQRRRWLRHQMVRGVDVFVAHAQSYLEEVRAAGHRGAGVVAPTMASDSAGPACALTMPGEEGVRILWCGRNHPVKGLDRLSRLAGGCFPARGARMSAIADSPPDLPPQVHIHTDCVDPRSHMSEFDVLVLTSRYEGQPNVMAEAALEGVPTVALGVGGIPEAIDTLGHGEAIDPGCSDESFTDLVIDTAMRYRDPSSRSDLQAAARQRYLVESRAQWRQAVESGIDAGRARGRSGVGMLVGGRGAAGLLSAAWLVGAARELGAATFGRLSLILAVGGLLNIVSDFGIPLTLTHRAASQGASRSLLGQAWRLRLALVLPTVILLQVVYRLTTGDHSLAPLIFGASMLASSFYTTFTAFLRGQGATRLEAANELFSRIAIVALGLPWLALGGGLNAAVGAYALVSLGSAVVIPGRAVRQINWVEDDPGGRQRLQLRSTLPLAAASMVNVIYYRLDLWILALFTGPATVAAYAVASRLADIVLLPSAALNSVSLALSEGRGKRMGLRSLCIRSLAMSTPGVVLGLLLAGPVLPVVLGPQFRLAVEPTRILLLSSLLTAVLLAIGPSVAVRRGKVFLVASLAALTGNVLLNLILIPLLGATGAALATLATEVLLMSGMLVAAGNGAVGDRLAKLLHQIDSRFTPETGSRVGGEL